MIHFADWLGHWSVDVYLLGSVLLILALIAMAALRQPVHRLAITKSLFIALALLAVLSSLPGWSVLHLITAKPASANELVQPAPPSLSPATVAFETPTTNLHPTFPILAPPSTRARIYSVPNFNIWILIGAVELTGAIGVLTWLATGWAAARKLQGAFQPAPLHVEQLLKEITHALPTPLDHLPRLNVSKLIEVPVALGFRHPTIVLPSRMVAQNPQVPASSTLAPILTHELAHIRNRDLQWLALSRALLILFWSQPLYWLARRRMRLDQESLADAAAAELTTRHEYAEQLINWARHLTTLPTMRLASAVGLWEGASQLRQRVALLLDERITVLRDFSRKWQFATLGVCTIIAAALSLVTLQPAQSQDQSLNHSAKSIAKAVAPTETEKARLADNVDYSVMGDRFVFCPVTTELQKSLLGDVDSPLKNASLCVFVNFAQLKEEPTDPKSPFFESLFDSLRAFHFSKSSKSSNDVVIFQLLIGPQRPMTFDVAQKRAESLAKTCEAIGKSAGFAHTRSSTTFLGADFDWSKYVSEAQASSLRAPASHTTPDEKSIGNDTIRVFAESTFLSFMLAHNTDCVVNIKPILSTQHGVRFPDDFADAMHEFIPKLKYASDNTLLARVRFAPSEQDALTLFVDGAHHRREFASKFGFKDCNLQLSQVATEDAEKRDQDEQKKTSASSGKATQPASSNDSPANPKPKTPNQPKPNTVAGLALQENHEPVTAAEVFLFRYDHSDLSRKLIGQTKTDSDGRFQFDNVIDIEKEFPGRKFPARDQVGNEFIQCIVRTPGLVPFEWMATPTQVAEQGMFQAAVMSTGATLAGRVTGPDGDPVTGALLTVGRGFGDWEGIKSARTDAKGKYQIADLKPFDLAAYQKQAEEAQRSGGDVFMAFPESLTIEAHNFATKQLQFAKIPGQQDVQLDRPAVLEGRAVYAGSNEPAPNIMVQASTMITTDNFKKFQSRQEFPVKTAVRTDQTGKYRFAALPPGSYSISAEIPDWVTTGVTATDATSEKTTQLPDLTFTKGGFIRRDSLIRRPNARFHFNRT